MPRKGTNFRQLSKEDRVRIDTLNGRGCSRTSIAIEIGCHKSTITRELNNLKNHGFGERGFRVKPNYDARVAWDNHVINKSKCGANCKAFVFQDLRKYIEEQVIKKKWSPDVAIGYAKDNNLFQIGFTARTVYNWIKKNQCNIKPHHLRYSLQRKRKRKREMRENKTKMGRSIVERPEYINNRSVFGHWEADCIVDKNHNAILVMQERKTRFFKMIKLEKMNSLCTFGKFNQWIAELGHAIKSITYDNGSEFALASRLPVDEYFTRPFAPHEKGGVENLNGRLRWDIPKSKNLASIPPEHIRWINENVNDTPRKILNYKTPSKIFELFSKNDILSQSHLMQVSCN